jgi:hypothetical protein
MGSEAFFVVQSTMLASNVSHPMDHCPDRSQDSLLGSLLTPVSVFHSLFFPSSTGSLFLLLAPALFLFF